MLHSEGWRKWLCGDKVFKSYMQHTDKYFMETEWFVTKEIISGTWTQCIFTVNEMFCEPYAMCGHQHFQNVNTSAIK